MMEQSERLEKQPIRKLLFDLALPATVGLLVMASYNVVDTIFVSRVVGNVGVAALSIAFPVQMIIMAIAGAIGLGGASVISRLLGAKNIDKANQVFGNVISLVIIISLAGLLFATRMLTPLLYLFGSTETILPYARDYLGIILYGTVFIAFGFSVPHIVRAEGNAGIAMISMLISAGLNVVFTPFFIYVLGMGVKGSALGTVLAKGLMALYLFFYFLRGKSTLSYNLSNLMLKLDIIKEILSIGASSFVRQAAGSIMFIVANHKLGFYGGDTAIAVLGIINRLQAFALMPILGIVQGMMPIVGYNYGACLKERVRETIYLGFKIATIAATLVFIIIMVFPRFLMLIFTENSLTIEMGIIALRIMFAFSIFNGIQMVAGGVFQALGSARAAFLLSMSRQILFLIPALFVLPLVFKLNGVWLSFPVADILSFFLALLFIKINFDIFKEGGHSTQTGPSLSEDVC
ncbi:MAG TPA: MATE family efflux transporter [Firmicutes bacterium]|nr:MATE family efflux transporter [Bacillota bacterium]